MSTCFFIDFFAALKRSASLSHRAAPSERKFQLDLANTTRDGFYVYNEQNNFGQYNFNQHRI